MLKQELRTILFVIKFYTYLTADSLLRDYNIRTVRNEDVQEEAIFVESWIGYVR